jgi:hypothetical protein
MNPSKSLVCEVLVAPHQHHSSSRLVVQKINLTELDYIHKLQ